MDVSFGCKCANSDIIWQFVGLKCDESYRESIAQLKRTLGKKLNLGAKNEKNFSKKTEKHFQRKTRARFSDGRTQ